MLTNAELLSHIDVAEQKFNAASYPEAYNSILPVLISLKEDAATKDVFSSEVLNRLVKLLRDLILKSEDSSRLYDERSQVVEKALKWYPDDVRLLNEQGWIFYFKNQYDKAHEAFKKAISGSTPAIDKEDRTYAVQGAGASLRELRCFSEAEAILRESSTTGEEPSSGILLERGWLRLYEEKYDLAFVDFEKALTTADEEDKPEVMAGQVAACLAEGVQNSSTKKDRGKELVNGWRKALQQKEVVDILAKCGEWLSYLNNYPAALQAYDLMLETPSDNQLDTDTNNIEKAYQSKVETLKWLRRFDEAEQVYRTAQEQFPQSTLLWNEMANTYYVQKRFEEAYAYYSGEAIKDRTFLTAQAREEFKPALEKDDEATEWTVVLLRKMRRLHEAEIKVDEALALHPDKVNFLGEKAVIYFSKQEYEKAISVFDRVLALEEYNEFALQWRAASYRKQGKFEQAKEKIEEALRKIPAAAGLWEERAWLSFDQDDLKKADEYFAESIKLDPYLIQRQFSRVEVLTRLNRNDEALEVFQRLQKQFPDDAEVREQLGWFYLRRGKLAHAQEEFLSIQRKDPDNVLAINGMGGSYLEERDFESAERAFLRALKHINYEPQYYLNLAWALIRQVKDPGELPKSKWSLRDKLLDEAAASCRNALELDPHNAKAYVCLGVIAFKRNAFLDAEGYFRKSLDLDPKDDSHIELGSLYVQMGRYDEAKTEFTEAIKVNGNDARAYMEMGNLLLLTGSDTEAVRECRQAISIGPHNQETHRALAIALMRAGQYDEAEKALRRALNIVVKSKQWQLHLMLSQILIRLGDDNNKDQDFYTEALKHVSEAKRTNPTPNAEIYFHEGIAQYKLEDYQRAHRSFKECLKANRDRFEAERYGRVVRAMIREQRRVLKVNVWASVFLAVLCTLMLSFMATFYYRGTTRVVPASEPLALKNDNDNANANAEEKLEAAVAEASEKSKKPDKPSRELIVDKSMLTFMIPLLLGLLVVALVLPNLNKLKLPGGFEAEISEPKTKDISSGPKGDIGFGSSLPIISPGPR